MEVLRELNGGLSHPTPKGTEAAAVQQLVQAFTGVLFPTAKKWKPPKGHGLTRR